MKNYKMNVNEYLSEETLEEITVRIGDDFGYMPFEEAEYAAKLDSKFLVSTPKVVVK